MGDEGENSVPPPTSSAPAMQQSEVRVKREILWQNVLFFIYLHMSAVYGLFLVFSQAQYSTIIFTFALILISTLSVTLGCHRLWTHAAYEANFFLRLAFIVGHTLTCQGPVYDWVLDHRIHHEHHGTELDPYNYHRGFSYTQIGCRLTSSHPQMEQRKRAVNMADVEKDSLVMWQKTLYWWLLMPIIGVFLPINIPLEYFGESFVVSFFVAGFLRMAVSLHCAWLINSATILWGLDPLDRRSADTNLIFVVNKSLWPHYHYMVPWDYQLSEYGNYADGFCNAALRVLAALGWARNLRTIGATGVRNALYQAAKLGKPVSQCLQQYELKPSFDQLISDLDKSRM